MDNRLTQSDGELFCGMYQFPETPNAKRQVLHWFKLWVSLELSVTSTKLIPIRKPGGADAQFNIQKGLVQHTFSSCL